MKPTLTPIPPATWFAHRTRRAQAAPVEVQRVIGCPRCGAPLAFDGDRWACAADCTPKEPR